MQTRALPDDIDTFKRLILASDARVSHLEQKLAASEQDGQLLTLLIEKLKLQNCALQAHAVWRILGAL